MDDAGAGDAADAGQLRSAVEQQGVDQRAALGAAGGMHDQAGLLVDDDDSRTEEGAFFHISADDNLSNKEICARFRSNKEMLCSISIRMLLSSRRPPTSKGEVILFNSISEYIISYIL